MKFSFQIRKFHYISSFKYFFQEFSLFWSCHKIYGHMFFQNELLGTKEEHFLCFLTDRNYSFDCKFNESCRYMFRSYTPVFHKTPHGESIQSRWNFIFWNSRLIPFRIITMLPPHLVQINQDDPRDEKPQILTIKFPPRELIGGKNRRRKTKRHGNPLSGKQASLCLYCY